MIDLDWTAHLCNLARIWLVMGGVALVGWWLLRLWFRRTQR